MSTKFIKCFVAAFTGLPLSKCNTNGLPTIPCDKVSSFSKGLRQITKTLGDSFWIFIFKNQEYNNLKFHILNFSYLLFNTWMLMLEEHFINNPCFIFFTLCTLYNSSTNLSSYYPIFPTPLFSFLPTIIPFIECHL